MGWIRNCLAMLVLMAAFAAPADPAPDNLGIMLSAATRGIDDEPDPAAARQRLRIADMAIDAKVVGPMADVQIDLLIESNDQDAGAEQEARLVMALPDDAVVTGYALDVGGRLIPGQLIEQAKARNVYEDTVRQGIDPGLAEVTAQNTFQTRIYPVSSKLPRRFRLRFSAPFDPVRGLALPLGTELPVGKTRVTLAAQGYGDAPALRLAGQQAKLQREGGAWRGAIDLPQSRLPGTLWIGGGKLAAPISVLRHENGRRFFVISDTAPAMPGAPRQGERLRIYWDRSLSHRLGGTADEIDALVALADRTRPAAIDLITFASGGAQVAALADGATLRRALESTTYRGATTLAGLDDLKLPDARRCVMVSDGRLTLDHAAAFRPDCPLFTLSADPAADAARLGRLAQRQQGKFVRIGKGKGSEAAAALGDAGNTVISVRDGDGARISWRTLAAPDGRWLLVGEMPDNYTLPSSAPLTVRVARPDGRVFQQQYDTEDPGQPLNAAGALWASDRVNELSSDPADRDAMVKLSRAFQVAGPAMSFLVLDNPQQYLAAEIAPPSGFPQDWQDQYKEGKAERAKAKRNADDARLRVVVQRWDERRAWWNQRFTPPKSGSRTPRGDRREQSAPVSAPPPQAAPALLADAAAAGADEEAVGGDEAQIVVTGARSTSSNFDSAVPISAVSNDKLASVEVKLEAMLADRPYLKALDAAPAGQRLAVLAAQEAEFGTLPAFYFDVAEWFRLKGDNDTARELLLSALELPESDDETLQIVAFRLERDGDYNHAVQLAERFAAAAMFRPQPQRVLASALAARGKARGRAGLGDLERAFALLTKVALDPQYGSGDFDGLEVIALAEANALIPLIDAAGGEWDLDPRLVALFDTDARIVIEWTADDADIDLWVDEPSGEQVMYSYKLSASGGQISNDMTDGYGPEEYAIRRAPKGEYRVRVNGYDADRINPNGPGHVLIRLGRNHGRQGVLETLVDVDLSFQDGPNRNSESKTRPIATLTVN